MNLKTNDIDELRRYISYYLDELAYGIKNDKRKFTVDEYINFFFLDVLTCFHYALPVLRREQFVNNLEEICKSLRRYNNEQVQNNSE